MNVTQVALIEILYHLKIASRGEDGLPANINGKRLQALAKKLSERAGRKKVWSWQYLHQAAKGNIEVSPVLEQSIMEYAATLDGTPASIVGAEEVVVWSRHARDIPPSTIVKGRPKHCKNPRCSVTFIGPGAFCCSDCRDFYWSYQQRKARGEYPKKK